MKKLSNNDGKLKKALLIKKSVFLGKVIYKKNRKLGSEIIDVIYTLIKILIANCRDVFRSQSSIYD